MNYNQLIIKGKEWFNDDRPFVLFSFPDRKEIHAYFQNTAEIFTTTTYNEQGFVMAPFDYKGSAIIIPREHAEFCSVTLSATSNHPEEDVKVPEGDQGKEFHLDIVKKAVKEIERGDLKKVVLSRKKQIALATFDIQTLADQIFKKNYQGFKYIWFHPKTKLWCGTTPETLLHLKGTTFTTTSLAGTKKVKEVKESYWNKKEVEEQEIVTNSIFDVLHNITPVLKMSKPYPFQAGTLVHLRTDVTGVVKKKYAHADKFIEALHPTPAVCGSPSRTAKRFIQKFESYDREYYTGFLGSINCEKRGTDLYVNLRSMKIENNIATLYVGGGIVYLSDPEKEWEETQNKLQTMLKVVAPML